MENLEKIKVNLKNWAFVVSQNLSFTHLPELEYTFEISLD
jgi:hypothetical protein